jgi:hypothetical protein
MLHGLFFKKSILYRQHFYSTHLFGENVTLPLSISARKISLIAESPTVIIGLTAR